MHPLRRSMIIACLVLPAACAPDLGSGAGDSGLDMTLDGPAGPNVEHVDLGDGVSLTRVDATSEEAWVYLDLADGTQREPSDPRADTDWDLAFQRFQIKLDGGVSGDAGVEAAALESAVFEDLEVAPAAGYQTDQPDDGGDDDDQPDYVLREWYEYDMMTHVLSPAPIVYVIRTAAGEHYKLQIEGYYDDAGTSGHLAFRWAAIDGP